MRRERKPAPQAHDGAVRRARPREAAAPIEEKKPVEGRVLKRERRAAPPSNSQGR